ncbi:uncharacterized protein MONOS_1898 [Monocercomonoides exilis]|uniref:uncharacterized protein n=1 Tax=Monocercomonoides exilis TaxID=2049356 RepID=UPI0035594043|nr:hypothetical protein MONOS_1898 [Monocercomonoides exilis]|eukprot:MONOS_1898.1-p1 / transcript=MONOS_1898.1 / gene=MONOS_1898 / organism=Monocercomonoides_exilis_PA203 / gene_product=unspecified product / transcript_product=unspecified product / location=Mono_scaffold00036:87536-87889(+) / protein_length=118 / sequence_SO=supercontig / SO=protein_coding / is_pseudo=false
MDPETKACTSTIEGFWSSLRSSFPRHGCREKFLSDYLSLFMIRQQNKYTFDEILEEIVHFKPDKEQEDDDEEEIPFEVEDDEHIPDEYDVLHGEDLSESDSDDLGAGDGSDASEYEG